MDFSFGMNLQKPPSSETFSFMRMCVFRLTKNSRPAYILELWPGQVLNGEIASVVKAKGEKQKYEVEVKGPIRCFVCVAASDVRHLLAGNVHFPFWWVVRAEGEKVAECVPLVHQGERTFLETAQ